MAAVTDNERFRILLRSYPVEALELLYDLYYNTLLRIAWKLTRDESAAKDIVHDAFLLVWSKRRQLSRFHEKSIEHYLARVVRNQSVTYFKRRRHVNIDDLLVLKGLYSADGLVDENFIRTEMHKELRRVISSFPKREQECLLMKIDREMSLDEIAAELNISRKMVEKSQTNALKRLKKWAASTS